MFQGAQTGTTLSTSLADVEGPLDYPQSVNFTLALEQCAAACDANNLCLSFNIFSYDSGAEGNCVPTYMCRLADAFYNASDYSEAAVGLASYSWSLNGPDQCSGTPYNVDTASQFTSPGGAPYTFEGGQNGRTVPPSSFAADIDGPDNCWEEGQWMDFGVALDEYSTVCDANPKCVSFNIFTNSTGLERNCSTQWTCRIRDDFYQASDYTEVTGMPSYAWSLVVPGQCSNGPIDLPTEATFISPDNYAYTFQGDQHGWGLPNIYVNR